MDSTPAATPTRSVLQWVIAVWLASRIALALVSIAGYGWLTTSSADSDPWSISGVVGLWQKWDANFYLDIAATGYPSLGQPGLTGSDIGRFAFFPLYSTAIALLGGLLAIHPVIAG